MYSKGNEKSAFTRKAGLFLLLCSAYYFFIGRDSGVVESSTSKDWAKSPKVLAKSMTEEQLDQFPPEAFSYIAMIDAGSSGCRAHVYRYGVLGHEAGPLYVLPKHDSLKVKPGLSSFKSSPSQAGPSLEGLITFLKSKVPVDQWATTPIYLKATAGLRLVTDAERQAILSSVRQYLADKTVSPFAFHSGDAEVISGIEEGAFGWISVNYLKQTIGPFKPTVAVNKDSAFAVIEMGGASTQVTQVAKTAHDEFMIEDGYKYPFMTQNERLVLYSHSYLGYGADKAREGLSSHLASRTAPSTALADPCLNPGYAKPVGMQHSSIYEGISSHEIIGKGNDELCHSEVEAAMFSKRHGGVDAKCHRDTTTVSFDCIHQPSFVRKSENILVFENFFYTASAVGTMPANHEANPAAKSGFPLHTSPKEFLDSAQEVCSVPWDSMNTRYPREPSQNSRWCFSTTYAYLFLTHGIGLADDHAITVQQSIGSADVEWALGATYKELSDELERHRKQV